VETGGTRNIEVKFVYGTAVLETEPSGATVESNDGRSLGLTPLRLTELRPGRLDFVLRRDGYETASVTLEITGEKMVSFHTNLVNSSYVRDMSNARQYLQMSDYDRALDAAGAALRIKAGDPEATVIQRQATVQKSLRQAEVLRKRGDYAAGINELETTLQVVPESSEAKLLLADLKKREADRVERLRQEQSSRAKAVFNAMAANNNDAGLFENHELKTSKSANEVKLAIIEALRNTQPAFAASELKSPDADTFILEAKQDVSGGLRQCLIVGGQTLPDETQIFFKVLEYTTGQSVTVLGVVSVKSNLILTAIHPSRIEQMTTALQGQVTEGIRMVTGLLRRAIE
jgi:hypothetical protein